MKEIHVYFSEDGVPLDCETGELVLPSDLIDAANEGKLWKDGKQLTADDVSDLMYG